MAKKYDGIEYQISVWRFRGDWVAELTGGGGDRVSHLSGDRARRVAERLEDGEDPDDVASAF